MKNSRRQNRIRYKLKKVTDRKRMTVFKSNNHIYVQVINDKKGFTLASASSIEKNMKLEKIGRAHV
jgi:large subunit ribosomal protein L18